MISLRLLDEISLDCILRMEHPPEEDFAASNAYSLAQARLHPEKYDTAACDCHPETTGPGMFLKSWAFCPPARSTTARQSWNIGCADLRLDGLGPPSPIKRSCTNPIRGF